MSWWEVLLMFVGAPLGLFVLITVVVMALVSSRVPDGLARLAEESTSADEEGVTGRKHPVAGPEIPTQGDDPGEAPPPARA